MAQAMGGKKARRFKFEDFMLWRADGDGRASRRRNRGFGDEDESEDEPDEAE